MTIFFILSLTTMAHEIEVHPLPKSLQKTQAKLILQVNKQSLKAKDVLQTLAKDSKTKKADQLNLRKIEKDFEKLILITTPKK